MVMQKINFHCLTGWFISFVFYLLSQPAVAQSDSIAQKNWQLGGYVKDLQTVSFTNDLNTLLTGQLIHHRLNFKWMPVSRFTFAAELRNRLFFGEQVKYTPDFAKSVDVGNGIVDLSQVWVDKNTLVLHSILDRLWAEYQTDKWSIRAGRQRINWGINTVWNPNDVFNSYNFLDFDYEERPGTDAVRGQFFLSDFTNLDMAIAPAIKFDDWIAAAKYGFNKGGYDFQILTGKYRTDAAIGAGWAGNIGNAGWKGELTYFHPYQDFTQHRGTWSAATGVDYMFSKGWYLNASMLFNSEGANSLDNLAELYAFNLSPKSLMPTKLTTMLQVAKSFTPLFNGSAAMLYSPNGHLLAVLPALSYNIALNWDVDLIGQVFFAQTSNPQTFNNLGNSIFLRLKWSY